MDITHVREISGVAIGRVIIRRCGNEGEHPYLNERDKATLRFLRAAKSFVPDAENAGADMKNTAFIIRQPGREFCIVAGEATWEFDFCEDRDGDIYVRCVRMSLWRCFWNEAQNLFFRVFVETPMQLALTAY